MYGGMADADLEAVLGTRPGFERNRYVKRTTSYIDGRQFLHFDPRARLRLFVQSVCVIVMMTFLVISLITSIFVFKIVNQDREEAQEAVKYAAPAVQAALIVVMDVFYQKIAIWLTNREGHRTDMNFEDSLVAKVRCAAGTVYVQCLLLLPTVGTANTRTRCIYATAQHALWIAEQ